MVLEEMLEHSEASSDDHGHRVAVVSVRSLAASLGVAKDTVHRATTRLRELGVIEPHQARTDAGNFSTGGYRLDIPVACLSIVDTAADVSAFAPTGTARRRSPGSSSVSDQLSLLLET
jgi:DNA-binding transcriptional MocR family regulator